jgi:hypothetical protein
MSYRLTDFLVDLATDPARRSRYEQDPRGELDRAGLETEDKEALLSGDSSRVRRALGHPDNDTMTQAANSTLGRRRKRPRKGAGQKSPGARKGAKAKRKGVRSKKR